MSGDHCEPIKLRLQVEGYNVAAHERSGQLTCVTTQDLLAKFMVDRELNEDLFRFTIGELIDRARASVSTGQLGRVRIFGEMVSQLRNSDLTATTRLEELWNEVISQHSVSLLCTYAMHNAGHKPKALIDLHSHSIEREPKLAQRA